MCTVICTSTFLLALLLEFAEIVRAAEVAAERFKASANRCSSRSSRSVAPMAPGCS